MTDSVRTHPEWPAHPGVEVGCDERSCATCYVQWWQQPLRDGEYDVPVVFRVTGDTADTARGVVEMIIATDQFERHIVPMFVPKPADETFVLERAENPHPRMLAEALSSRALANATDVGTDPVPLAFWHGYLSAMCAATGEAAEAIEAWMDRIA